MKRVESEDESESNSLGPKNDLLDYEEELEMENIKIKEITTIKLYLFSESPIISFENYLTHEL